MSSKSDRISLVGTWNRNILGLSQYDIREFEREIYAKTILKRGKDYWKVTGS